MKFCKWIIEKNNHFIELNRTSFLILWHCGAIWYIYNGYFKNIVSYLFLAGCILIFLFKIGNLTQLKCELFDFVNWYNNIRIHGSLNYLTPVEFRKWQSTKKCPKKGCHTRVANPEIYKNSLWNKYNNKNDDSWINKGNIVNSQINIIHLS